MFVWGLFCHMMSLCTTHAALTQGLFDKQGVPKDTNSPWPTNFLLNTLLSPSL